MSNRCRQSIRKQPSFGCRRPNSGCLANCESILDSFAAIVAQYITCYRRRAKREGLDYFRLPKHEAIKLAALGKKANGDKHKHQYRIPPKVLAEGWNALRRSDFESFQSFDALFDHISKAFARIGGLGELATYDIAQRIGARLRLEPERVFLHAGTRVGARSLGFRGDSLGKYELVKLDRSFSKLTPSELEDCLCIYKAEFREIAGKAR